jgi:predicted transcriptional regulator YdeE
LRTPIFTHGKVALYNDNINLQQPNDGYHQSYKFSINAEGNWVGWINVKISYAVNAYYNGQIGYEIYDESRRNKGYMTDACLALKPFIKKFYDYIMLTVDENNIASRRVCEKIGAQLTDIIDTPEWQEIYKIARKYHLYRAPLWQVGFAQSFADGSTELSIGAESKGGEYPNFDLFEIPAATWAVFSGKGRVYAAFAELLTRIFSEWMPSSGYEQSMPYTIEIYPPGNSQSDDYAFEIWIPVKKK